LNIHEQQTLQEYFLRLSREFDHILAIFASNELCSLIQDSSRALEAMEHRLNLQIIDSQTISIGLGYLVQTASNLIAGGATAADAERWIRNLIPHQYTLLCTSGLSYLHASGYLDHAQATAGEILNFLPIFTLEEGRLTPVEKLRNFRQVMDYYQEFLEEFDHFQYIAFVQGHPTLNTESRLLRQFVQENFPKTPFTEHTLSSAAATLIGPKSISLFITEKF
jgi:DegV family protein with EDD domain